MCVATSLSRANRLPPSVDGSHLIGMGRSRNALWVCPSIRLGDLHQKLEKISTFQAATDPSGNQIAVIQIHSTRLLIFLKKCGINRIVFSHLFASSFVFLSTNRLCSRKRFDWLGCVYKD